MSEDEVWEWANSGTPDDRADRGRIYYRSVSVHRRGSSRKRFFRVGDPVVMSGDDGQVWIAQIVNLFQAQENDIHIKELIRNSVTRTDDERRHELMRCTLRWFYNLSDMNQHTLNTSHVPKPIPDEIWFSDHVEQDGFNDVQVIEGRAWLFPSLQAKQAFSRDPDAVYDKRKDRLCVVRCFVNSKSDLLPVRELERTELDRLLRHPTTDKDLFENSRLRLYGSTGAVLKGTGKKKRRHSTIRSPVNVDDEEFAPNPPEKRSRVHGVEAKVELGLKGVEESERAKARAIRRRKIVDNDDDEEIAGFDKPVDSRRDPADDEPLTNRLQALDQQQQAEARSLEKENEEVFAWVTELNNNAYKGDLDERPKPSESTAPTVKPNIAAAVNDVSVVEKASSSQRRSEVSGKHNKEQKTRPRETETIVIDDDGDGDVTPGRKAQRRKVPIPPRSDKKQSTSRQARFPATGRAAFAGKPFMPTQRARKSSSSAPAKSTSSTAAAKSVSSPAAAKIFLPTTGAKNMSSAVVTKKTVATTVRGTTSIATAKNIPSSSLNRTRTAVPPKRTPEPGTIRHNLERTSNIAKKPNEKDHARKEVPQPSSRQERSSKYHRPADREFLAEMTDAMESMKLNLEKMPTESKSVVKGRIEWVVSSVIDKMFDGRKERAHDVGDTEARKIVDLTFVELRGIYARGLKGNRNADKSQSGVVEV